MKIHIIFYSILFSFGNHIFSGNENIWNKFPSESPLHRACTRKDAPKECRLLEALMTRKRFTTEEGRQLLAEGAAECERKNLSENERKACAKKSEFWQMIDIMNICEHVGNIEKAYDFLSHQVSDQELFHRLEQRANDEDTVASVADTWQKRQEAKETTDPFNVAAVLAHFTGKIEELTMDLLEKEYGSSDESHAERRQIADEARSIIWNAFFEKTSDIWEKAFSNNKK